MVWQYEGQQNIFQLTFSIARFLFLSSPPDCKSFEKKSSNLSLFNFNQLHSIECVCQYAKLDYIY